MKFLLQSLNISINSINSLWQIFWDFCDTSELYSIQNKVNIPYNFNLKRSDQIVISRIRIGLSKLTHIHVLKKEQPKCIFCDCPSTLHHIFLECSDTLPARNLHLNNVQTVQDLKYRFISVIFCIFKIFFILNVYVRQMGRSMVPRVKDNNPLGTQKISLKSRIVRAARGTSKFQNWSHLTNSRRRYMAEILPIRRKTLSNQSVNQSNIV